MDKQTEADVLLKRMWNLIDSNPGRMVHLSSVSIKAAGIALKNVNIQLIESDLLANLVHPTRPMCEADYERLLGFIFSIELKKFLTEDADETNSTDFVDLSESLDGHPFFTKEMLQSVSETLKPTPIEESFSGIVACALRSADLDPDKAIDITKLPFNYQPHDVAAVLRDIADKLEAEPVS